MTPTKHCSHILDQSTELEVSIFLTPNGGKEVVIEDCTGGPPRIHESSIPELLQYLAGQFPQARASAGGTESERFNALLEDYRAVLETLEEMQAPVVAQNDAGRAAPPTEPQPPAQVTDAMVHAADKAMFGKIVQGEARLETVRLGLEAAMAARQLGAQEQAAAVLRRLEWAGGDMCIVGACPMCGGLEDEGGHKPHCELAAALKTLDGLVVK
jgi:hypothetical protein